MAYKDSFVDEYPYLVYSDDPEAVGGAGGGVGVPFDSALSPLSNATGNALNVYILGDANGETYIADPVIGTDAALSVAPNAFVGIVNTYHVHVGAIDAGYNLDPVGSFTIYDLVINVYQLTVPDQEYSIMAS